MEDDMTKKEAIAELKALEKQSEELFAKYFDIRERRKAARVEVMADMQCECDANSCTTSRSNETINEGELHSFCHDDQDGGSVYVYCVSGELDVIVSTAVWNTFSENANKTIKTKQYFKYNIPDMSSWYDQTNRVEIIGKASTSKYNLTFNSWDN
jgi:hypothetical protein